jgi:2-amino-4-hydroxy-6-hydroxymethyldihydropteridine diphosphokinase
MRAPVTAFIGIGANLGDPVRAVRGAIASLGGLPATRLVRASSLYRTAPHEAGGPDYVNAVAQVETALEPLALLDALQQLESQTGRERPYRNAPRTLDLDLLLYGGERMATPRLVVPHPRMHERAFVLVPLAEIAPEHVATQQLAAVAGQRVERLALPPA